MKKQKLKWAQCPQCRSKKRCPGNTNSYMIFQCVGYKGPAITEKDERKVTYA